MFCRCEILDLIFSIIYGDNPVCDIQQLMVRLLAVEITHEVKYSGECKNGTPEKQK